MKQAYCYFLYCIYRYYKVKRNESDLEAIVGVVAVSTLFLFFNFGTLQTLLVLCGLIQDITNIIYAILIMLLLGVFNYYFFIKDKSFLKCIHTRSKRKNFWVLVYMFTTVVLAIGSAYMNRQKVYSERPPLPEHLRKESLEGRIRDWIRDL